MAQEGKKHEDGRKEACTKEQRARAKEASKDHGRLNRICMSKKKPNAIYADVS